MARRIVNPSAELPLFFEDKGPQSDVTLCHPFVILGAENARTQFTLVAIGLQRVC